MEVKKTKVPKDPELDPLSPFFNSQKAITVTKVTISKGVKVFDNFNALEVAYKRIDGQIDKYLLSDVPKTLPNQKTDKTNPAKNLELGQRKFLSHQGKIFIQEF